MRFCKQDAVNVSLESKPASGSQLRLVIYRVFPLSSDRFSCLPSATMILLQVKPCAVQNVSPNPHTVGCKTGVLKRFPAAVSSLAPPARRKSLKALLSMHRQELNQDKLLGDWQRLLPSFLPFFLSLPFPVSPFFQPSADSTCTQVTHSFLWKVPFLMIWQPERKKEKKSNPSSHSFRKPR